MRGKRLKTIRRHIAFYKANFSIQPPYRVVVDGTFCKAALQCKVNIGEQLPKYLDAEVKLYTTKCVIAECEAMGSLLYGPWKVLQQYEVKECIHPAPVLAAKCMYSFIRRGNDHNFFIATQDKELSERVRSIPGVPLLFIDFNAITLEAPSQISRETASGTLLQKLRPSQHQQDVLTKLKIKTFGDQSHHQLKKKRREPKGPNPLSCKKSKKQGMLASTSGGNIKKKRRRKARGVQFEVAS